MGRNRPAVRPRLMAPVRDVVREVRQLWREQDVAALGPRVCSFVYLAGGLLAWVVSLVGPVHQMGTVRPMAITAALFGAVAGVMPWPRWPERAQIALGSFAFVLFAWGGIATHELPGPFLAALPLPFVYFGYTQRPGTSAMLAPLGALSLLLANRGHLDSTLAATMLFGLPISVLVGETIAQSERHRARGDRQVARLLNALRVMARVHDERAGAQIVASLAAELLGAQAVSVLLADRDGGRRFLNRAFFGHPALADTAPLLMDGYSDDRNLRGGRTTFVALPRSSGAVRAAAIIPLPGASGAPLGLIVAMWGTPRRRFTPAARQAAELLSDEAGRMFQRVREAAELEHDAHTDPLTDLANRRTFARALQTMLPGDALVIVDLDHFKSVNDRFGHQTGDETLRTLARCLRDTARQVDCVARYGGEEFAIVLPAAGEDGAMAMLDRTRAAWEATTPFTTFSSGVAVHTGTGTARDTLRRADAALYAAKEAGRNRDVIARDEISIIEAVAPERAS